jgi:hypothetical protein
MAYVYRHIRKDTGECFYIGIGSDANYHRANTKSSRNTHWKNIVNSYGYTVDILLKDIEWNEAIAIEIYLIDKIGRRDLSTGPLVNMTAGGDGTLGRPHSEESRKKMSESSLGKYVGEKNPMYGKRGEKSPHFGKKYSEDRRIKIGESRKFGKHPLARLVLDMQTGIYYSCGREASEAIGIKYSRLRDYLVGRSRNKTSLIYI